MIVLSQEKKQVKGENLMLVTGCWFLDKNFKRLKVQGVGCRPKALRYRVKKEEMGD